MYLKKLHRRNGWNLVFLIASGFLLYAPGMRGPLALFRTPLKYLHIGSGLLSIVILIAYLPHAPGHWNRLRNQLGQKANLLLSAGLLVGWAATGLALWWGRALPPNVVGAALVWHDRLTWFALPWIAAHSITRYYRVKVLPVTTPAPDRRLFMAGAATVLGAILWGQLGRKLGIPGFEPAVPGEQPTSRMTPNQQPLENGALFQSQMPGQDAPSAGRGYKGRFRVYTVTDSAPAFDPVTWRFTVTGLVDRPLDIPWGEFSQLPSSEQVSDFHCVTGWSVQNCTWTGIRLADLLDRAGVRPSATHVQFISSDGEYTDAVSLDVARMQDVMLAYRLDGSPLPTPLGGPVRLIIPRMYAYKSVKWVHAIALIDKPHAGYWEVRGYPSDAWTS
ncbi:MAG TPA: molybdopterin-dependent oxidoreductase [Symbiobacteriaceae bacterium]|nr:molybdopterin-dependent oxidoreductase [Symbiobacteriaceae bacterium]